MEDRFEELMLALRLSPIVKTFIEQDKIPCLIEKGLYLGSLGAANMRETLKTLNVTHVLTVRGSRAQFYPNDFVYKTILVKDREYVNIRSYFDECFAFIDEAKAGGGGVLVHCTAGISRSASVVVAYLMFKNGTSFYEALQHVKLKRPMASPNLGFRCQLQDYETSLRSTTTLTMNNNNLLQTDQGIKADDHKVMKTSKKIAEAKAALSASCPQLTAPATSLGGFSLIISFLSCFCCF